ncbi:hypothetical protein [Sphingobium sp.]|uniref:hypothetical protein n=1 Tax=Sphingobium sp. TaxID=1912891 RepID=UPI002B8ADFBE|nr:hypothetical protein [Sphingobium sp.]HUD91297.1 hypothetical protein [Sphingobium sp.]
MFIVLTFRMSLETILGDTHTGPSLLSIPPLPRAPPARDRADRNLRRSAAAAHAPRPGRPQLPAASRHDQGKGETQGMAQEEQGAVQEARR